MKQADRLSIVARHMPRSAVQKVEELAKLQVDLRMLNTRIGEVMGRMKLSSEYRNYTKGWLTSFAFDPDQSGSIESLIEGIISKYVDEDNQPWDED